MLIGLGAYQIFMKLRAAPTEEAGESQTTAMIDG
jgi:hypothetical protein